MLKKTIVSISSLILLSMTISCNNPSSTNGNNTGNNSGTAITKSAVIKDYSQLVYTNYLDALNQAKEMQTAIKSFVENPSAESLEAAKTAWLQARKPYGQTEGYRFYDGPIDSEEGPEGQLNAWPLDEVYIDYVESNPDGGIINNPEMYPEINSELLSSLNEEGGDKNISTGYHAIEFLLWGQDLSEGAGAGMRPYTDYLTDGNGTASNQERRGKYLLTVTDLLVSDLQTVTDAWAPENDSNYRSEFQKMAEDEALAKILKGIGTLSASELSSERMATPLDVGEREEEHSCFSDNTHDDILRNAQSIQNVYLGTYTGTDGKSIDLSSIYDLVKEKNQALAERLKSEMAETMTKVKAIQAPFDQEIKPGNEEGNKRVQEAINALKKQGASIVEAASALGLTINTDL